MRASRTEFLYDRYANSGFQSQIYTQLVQQRLPHKLSVVLLPRVLRHLDGHAVDHEALTSTMDGTLHVARTLPPQVGWALVRLWCNGWPTSSRMGGKLQHCIFGCQGEDSLRHYITCPLLWEPVLKLCKMRGFTWTLSTWNSLALADTELVRAQLLAIVVASDAYNSFRCSADSSCSSLEAFVQDAFCSFSHLFNCSAHRCRNMAAA